MAASEGGKGSIVGNWKGDMAFYPYFIDCERDGFRSFSYSNFLKRGYVFLQRLDCPAHVPKIRKGRVWNLLFETVASLLPKTSLKLNSFVGIF